MSINVKRFKADLDTLVGKSRELQLSMVFGAYGNERARKMLSESGVSDKDLDEAQKTSAAFGMIYQSWYSEALALIKQVLPDRLADFIAQYEKPRTRKDISHENYVIADFLVGLQTSRGGDVIVDSKAAIPRLQNQIAILAAASKRFDSSLFEIRQLVQADLFDSEIDSAKELLKQKFARAAGAIAGVVLEKHLQQVANDHVIQITKKNPSIGDLNELLKAKNVIDISQWRFITFLADIRNLCDHKKSADPTDAQVRDLIDGVDKVLKTIT